MLSSNVARPYVAEVTPKGVSIVCQDKRSCRESVPTKKK